MSDVELRSGEAVVQCAGGQCCVCKMRIAPGPAVQVSSSSNYIRHTHCMPKKDARRRKAVDKVEKELPE